jgi:hypothetical protein
MGFIRLQIYIFEFNFSQRRRVQRETKGIKENEIKFVIRLKKIINSFLAEAQSPQSLLSLSMKANDINCLELKKSGAFISRRGAEFAEIK